MRILIAGCGYVGMRLAEKLIRSGHDVFGLRRNPPELPAPVQWIRGDLTNLQGVVLPSSLDTLVLAAGLRRDAEENYQRLFIDGYRTLIDTIRNHGHPIRRIVLVSSTGVFAEENGGWVDEQSPVNPDRSPGRYYLEAETLAHASGWSSSVVRLSGIYGPDRIRLIREVREGRAFHLPPPPHYLNQIHADDAAGALAHVTTMKDPEKLYIATDREPADRNNVLHWISEYTGVGKLPDSAEPSSRPLRRSGNKRCRSDRLVSSGYSFFYPTYREGYRNLIDTGQS